MYTLHSFAKLILSLKPDVDQNLLSTWIDLLEAHYMSSGRYYHGINHLNSLLDRLDTLKPFSYGENFKPGLDRLHETEVAIWFHDALYDPSNKFNEEWSANLCKNFMQSVGLTSYDQGRFMTNVLDAILATKHNGSVPNGNGARVMVDLDLAHFADPWDVFNASNYLIRKEYASVPDETYRVARISFLAKLMIRPIYTVLTDLEAPARHNLKRHIEELITGW